MKYVLSNVIVNLKLLFETKNYLTLKSFTLDEVKVDCVSVDEVQNRIWSEC